MKKPKNNLQAVLYCLIRFSRDKRKAVSTFDLIEMTKHLGISQRIGDLRALGIDIKCSMKAHKNHFGNYCEYGHFFIPSNQIDEAVNLYESLIKDK